MRSVDIQSCLLYKCGCELAETMQFYSRSNSGFAMIVKIVLALCAVTLAEASTEASSIHDCIDRYNSPILANDQGYCKVSASEVSMKAWYQTDTILYVVDGIFGIRLLSEYSRPISLDAEGKGVVRIARTNVKIKSLKRLSLEDNLMTRINSSAFQIFPELIYLNLAHNRIEYLDVDSFKGLAKLEILKLNHNSVKILSNSINDDALPVLTHLYLRHNQLTDINDYGKRMDLCHSNLEHLDLSDNILVSFYPNVQYTSCFNNLTQLYLDENKLDHFEIGSMPLEGLSLDGNNLREIPILNPSLKALSMSRNRIVSVNNYKSAKNLLSLILSYNMITNWHNDTISDNLGSLVQLVLDYNFLTSITNETFYNLPSLQSLFLTANRIKEISKKSFSRLPVLQKIFIDNNQLTNFPDNEPFGQSNLTYIDLANNKIENISDIQTDTIPHLKFLNLTGNPLISKDTSSVSKKVQIML